MQEAIVKKSKITIGALSRETGCKIPTIRYYEKIGLMPEPQRSAGNTRIYDHTHLQRLTFIRHCSELGFNQRSISDLLRLTDHPSQPCGAVTEIARTHLDTVNQQIAKLAALKAELENMIEACQGGRIANCRIVEALADHSPTNG